jgi:hypothetical protein
MFVNFHIKRIIKIFVYRLVNDLLKDEMKKIHAFSQKTYTPDEWEKKQQKEATNPEVKTSSACLGGCGNSKK